MGQKVNPIGFRVGVIKTWESLWFFKGDKYAQNLHEDLRLRQHLKKKLKGAAISKIEIARTEQKVKVILHTARPGVLIGKKGAGVDLLKADLQKKTTSEVYVSIQEVRKPNTEAQLVAESIATQIERRVAWRRCIKKALGLAVQGGVKGIKIMMSGRLGGAEIARSEWYTEKSVPLHTLRADIDYGFAEALTTYGITGIKVWIYKGDVLSQKEAEEMQGA